MAFFSNDDERVPVALRPYAAALDLAPARPDAVRGWVVPAWPAAPFEPLRPGAPPHDGVYRGSWISRGMCLRVDPEHLPAAVAERLRARLAAGSDGALYVFGVDGSSQRVNIAAAFAVVVASLDP